MGSKNVEDPFKFEAFMNTLIIENKPEETLRTYRKAIKKFLDYNKGKAITTDACLAFLVNMKTVEKLKPSTIKLYMIVLKRYFKFIKVPFPEMKLPSVPLGPPVFIEKEDFKKLYDATEEDPILRAQLSMCYSSAMRISELCTRKMKDVDLDKARVFVAGKTGPETDAWLPLSATAVSDAKAYLTWRSSKGLPQLQPEDYFFHRNGRCNEPFSTSTIESHLYCLGERVGIGRKSWHKVRHSRATHLREDDVDMIDIKDLLRHKSIKTTERYARSDTEKLRAKLSGRGELNASVK